LFRVSGAKATGKLEDAATARESVTPERSEQRRSNWSWVNSNRWLIPMSVAFTTRKGTLPCGFFNRSAKVFPSKIVSL
jgi:hypothetical protein